MILPDHKIFNNIFIYTLPQALSNKPCNNPPIPDA